MSHAYNKADGTFPHSKTGGVLGFPHSAKSKAIEKMEGKKGEKMEHKVVTSKQHKKIMREQGTGGYGKYK